MPLKATGSASGAPADPGSVAGTLVQEVECGGQDVLRLLDGRQVEMEPHTALGDSCKKKTRQWKDVVTAFSILHFIFQCSLLSTVFSANYNFIKTMND
jgi:hypothetical protein